ncbi:hypothetical protein V8F20_012077 [Naviculisporaceae sp. PSN 640]
MHYLNVLERRPAPQENRPVLQLSANDEGCYGREDGDGDFDHFGWGSVGYEERSIQIDDGVVIRATNHNNKTPELPGGNGQAVMCFSNTRLSIPTCYNDQAVHVTLIDFYTGETLVTLLINLPVDSVADWCVGEKGLDAKMIKRASWNGKYYCFDNWVAAREKMWDYINKDTIIVGHGLERDLGALKMAHALVVDLKLVVAGWLGICAVDKETPGHASSTSTTGPSGNLQLENLTECLLGLRIRGTNKYKRQSRDTLEEVLAIRETVMWCLDNQERVQNWSVAEKHGYCSY